MSNINIFETAIDNEKSKISDNSILRLKELLSKQLKNISVHDTLSLIDLRRIVKFTDKSIFSQNECVEWKGYVINDVNNKRGKRIGFYFNLKKVSLHRILYNNFIDPLTDDYFIKFTCNNTNGRCCNINHMLKYKYDVKQKKTHNDKKIEYEKIIIKFD